MTWTCLCQGSPYSNSSPLERPHHCDLAAVLLFARLSKLVTLQTNIHRLSYGCTIDHRLRYLPPQTNLNAPQIGSQPTTTSKCGNSFYLQSAAAKRQGSTVYQDE